MKYIRIEAERNSGNNFLFDLLQKNITNAELLASGVFNHSGWFHGYADEGRFNHYDDIIYICIVRELKSWLNSMYNRSYFLNQKGSFVEFIDTKLEPLDPEANHPINLDERERDNIFNVRYGKYQSYKKLMENNNVLLINMDYLQNNIDELFVLLRDNFNIECGDDIDYIEYHTKTGNKERNDTSYEIYDIPTDIYEKRVNKEIEEEINKLTFKISVV